MNKGQLIEAVVKDTKYSKKEVGEIITSMITTISKKVKKEPVQLVGFGGFKVVKTKARNGVNPATGEKIKIKAKRVLKFKASKALKV